MKRLQYSPEALRDLAVFLVRLTLGVVFVAHGSQKLLSLFGGAGPAATVARLARMGGPAVFAWIAIIAEFFGGLGVLFGVLPRTAAAGILVVMIVAVLKVHLANGFFMNWFGTQKGEGFEYHLLVMAMALFVMLGGPGRFTLIPDVEGWLLFGRKR